jgi:hypothetical protein
MRKLLFAPAITLLALATVPVRATPLSSLAKTPSDISSVAMGCGVGLTRGPYGNCHPIGGYGYGYGYHPYYHPYAYAHPYYHPYAHPYYHPY